MESRFSTTTRSPRWSPWSPLINAANRLGVIVDQKGGSYEPGMFASLTS
jgi:hypothetical protein